MIFIVLCEGWNHQKQKEFQFLCEADTGFERLSLYLHKEVILRQASDSHVC